MGVTASPLHRVTTCREGLLDRVGVCGLLMPPCGESTGLLPLQVASMNQRRVDFYLASIGDVLVAVGGRNENGALSSVEIYSPKIDSWAYVAGLPR